MTQFQAKITYFIRHDMIQTLSVCYTLLQHYFVDITLIKISNMWLESIEIHITFIKFIEWHSDSKNEKYVNIIDQSNPNPMWTKNQFLKCFDCHFWCGWNKSINLVLRIKRHQEFEKNKKKLFVKAIWMRNKILRIHKLFIHKNRCGWSWSHMNMNMRPLPSHKA